MLLPFMDLPLLVLFGACVTLGMINVVAGVTAAVVFVLAYLGWRRLQSSYRCDRCEKTMKYADVVGQRLGSPR